MFGFVVGAIFVCWGVGLEVAGICFDGRHLRHLVFPGLVEFVEYEEWLACTMGTGMFGLGAQVCLVWCCAIDACCAYVNLEGKILRIGFRAVPVDELQNVQVVKFCWRLSAGILRMCVVGRAWNCCDWSYHLSWRIGHIRRFVALFVHACRQSSSCKARP